MNMFKSGTATGTVKWFNATKGFGFITAYIDGATKDVFIGRDEAKKHESDLIEGAEVHFSYFTGQKGLAVNDLASVTVPTIELSGTVKWFDVNKGFGYARTKDGDVRLTAAAVDDYVDVLFPKAPLTMLVVKTNRGFDLREIVSVKTCELPEGFVQGKVKMPKGKDFGFIEHNGFGIFIHQNTVKEAGAAMWDGMELEFRAEMGSNGPHVVEVRPVGSGDEPEVAEVAETDAEEAPVEAETPAEPKVEAEKTAKKAPKRKRAPRTRKLTRAQKAAAADAAKVAEVAEATPVEGPANADA